MLRSEQQTGTTGPLNTENRAETVDELPYLRPRYQRFAEEWLIDHNATQAYARAGGSARTAHIQGPRLLANPSVRAYLEVRQKQQLEALGLTSQQIARDYLAIARADRASVFAPKDETDAVVLLHPEDWPQECRAALAGFKARRRITGRGDEREEWEILDVRFEPKEPYYRQLGKMVRLVPTEYKVADDGSGGPSLTVILTELMALEKQEKAAKEVKTIEHGPAVTGPYHGPVTLPDGPSAGNSVEAGGASPGELPTVPELGVRITPWDYTRAQRVFPSGTAASVIAPVPTP
jgi:phage terminase small subunit